MGGWRWAAGGAGAGGIIRGGAHNEPTGGRLGAFGLSFALQRGGRCSGRLIIEREGTKLHVTDLGAKDALAELLALSDDAVSGWDLGPSQAPGPISWLPTFVNDFEVEDDATAFGLTGFHLTVDDADGLREGRDRRTDASPTTHAPAILGVWTRQGASGHAVASSDVFLEPVHRGAGVELGRGRARTRLDRKVYIPNVEGLRLGPSLRWWGEKKKNRVREAASVQPNLKSGIAHLRSSAYQQCRITFTPTLMTSTHMHLWTTNSYGTYPIQARGTVYILFGQPITP